MTNLCPNCRRKFITLDDEFPEMCPYCGWKQEDVDDEFPFMVIGNEELAGAEKLRKGDKITCPHVLGEAYFRVRQGRQDRQGD